MKELEGRLEGVEKRVEEKRWGGKGGEESLSVK
jgi:hypothetical protein